MKYCFVVLLLSLSVQLKGQDTLISAPKRYVKIAAAPFLRLEAEWKQSERKSKNLALNVYLAYNYFNGFKIQASNRNYYFKKRRWFWVYHVGIGYVERVKQYIYFEKHTQPGPTEIITETSEIVFRKHNFFTAGAGTGIGWQRTLGKKRKWLIEGSAGIQYYYVSFSDPKTEKETDSKGNITQRSWLIFERQVLWQKHPWEDAGNVFRFKSGVGTPFSLFYGNLLIGHSF